MLVGAKFLRPLRGLRGRGPRVLVRGLKLGMVSRAAGHALLKFGVLGAGAGRARLCLGSGHGQPPDLLGGRVGVAAQRLGLLAEPRGSSGPLCLLPGGSGQPPFGLGERRLRGGTLTYRRSRGKLRSASSRAVSCFSCCTGLFGFGRELGRVTASPGRLFVSRQMTVPLGRERSDPAQPFG